MHKRNDILFMKQSVVLYLDEMAARVPRRVALAEPGESLSFSEYRRRAQAVATCLVALVGEGNCPIAVYMKKGMAALVSFMGILYSGNCYSPLPYRSPKERIQKMLNILDAPLVLTNRREASFLEECGVDPSRILLYDDALAYALDEAVIASRLAKVIDTDPAYVLFTSGSTGTPKGVVLPHRAIIDFNEWAVQEFGLDESVILGSQAPFHFDASMPDIFLPLFCGACLHIIPEEKFIFPVELLEYIASTNINTLIWVPSALMGVCGNGLLGSIRLPKLQRVLFCGEVMPNKHLNQWRAVYPDVVFVNLYGPTEAAYACTYFIVNRLFFDDDSLPIGRGCANTEIILLSEENKRVVQEKVIGELCIRGSCLALGYLGNEEKTREAFVRNPVNRHIHENIYRTGDLACYNSYGELEYAGRKDFQIKHLGYRIELGEIETAVLSVAQVRNACVLYDAPAQEIVLFYEADEKECTQADILRGIKAKIPKYMYPSKYRCIDKLPLNMNGKVDRVLLRNTYLGKEETP